MNLLLQSFLIFILPIKKKSNSEHQQQQETTTNNNKQTNKQTNKTAVPTLQTYILTHCSIYFYSIFQKIQNDI